MIRLYQAENLPQAQLLLDRLAAAGIEAHIFNANAQGIAGETPVTETLPEIWLENPSDEAAARAIVDEFEQQLAAPVTERPCPYCGAMNPSTFEICWKCGKELPK